MERVRCCRALISGERVDWLPRARMILESGESLTFEPFDRSGHVREGEGRSLEELLDEFARLRSENLGEVSALNLGKKDLERRGRHPAFGVVTLSELLATWATHDPTYCTRSRGLWRTSIGKPWPGARPWEFCMVVGTARGVILDWLGSSTWNSMRLRGIGSPVGGLRR